MCWKASLSSTEGFAYGPMGWSHALWWCQTIHQQVVSEIGADAHNRLEDRSSVPGGECMHLEYVDNFVVLGTDAKQVNELADKGVARLRDRGLVVHEEESSAVDGDGIKVLGWQFRGAAIQPVPKRVWRVRLAMSQLLKQGACSGKELEKVIGHAAVICLGRRESLSVFGEVYTFIQRYYHSVRKLWKSVRRELQIFVGICPLIWRDLAMGWDKEVTAIDASNWGLGATTSFFPDHEVRELGKFSERWRFEHDNFRNPRATALGISIADEDCEASALHGPPPASRRLAVSSRLMLLRGSLNPNSSDKFPLAAFRRNGQ